MRSGFLLLLPLGVLSAGLQAQAPPPLDSLVLRLARLSAVTGFEDEASDSLLASLTRATSDAAGNVVWTRGRGLPVRAALCPIDEPGWVVGGITPEGYLTLRRVGLGGRGDDRWLEGQRVTVFGAKGRVPGVVGVRSIHLQRDAPAPAGDREAGETFGLEEAYVDVGGGSARETEELGIGVPSPVTRAKEPRLYGPDRVAAPAASTRAACAALLDAALRLGRGSPRGTAVVVFTRGRSLGRTGAAFAVERGGAAGASHVVLLGESAPRDSLGTGFVAVTPDSVPTAGGYHDVSAWSLPTGYAGTPVETVSLRDVAALAAKLTSFLGGG